MRRVDHRNEFVLCTAANRAMNSETISRLRGAFLGQLLMRLLNLVQSCSPLQVRMLDCMLKMLIRSGNYQIYLEGRCLPSNCFSNNDLGIVVFEHSQETNQARVVSGLPRETESM